MTNGPMPNTPGTIPQPPAPPGAVLPSPPSTVPPNPEGSTAKGTTPPQPPAPPEQVYEDDILEILETPSTLELSYKPKKVQKAETEAVKAVRLQTEIDTFVLKCVKSYEYFAGACLKIKTKTDGIQPLIFNVAQKYLNDVAEKMLKKHGHIRIVIVKGRQQGLSTWVEGRGYWKTSQFSGVNAYILAHEDKATTNLFNMAKRYHEYCPAEIKPLVQKSNAKELKFNEMESEYAVGTAKTGDAGRGQTLHFFHGSECAYWRAADEISSGAMEGIPEGGNTEVYMESTAAGPSGYFAGLWTGGCYPGDKEPAHWNGYWRVFIPWFWEPAYRRAVPEDFILSDDEKKVKKLHKLDNEQMAWRRRKIAAFKGDLSRFQRDYPANPAEAFNSKLTNVLIRPEVALTAMKASRDELFIPVGRMILGVDVAREGDDDTALVIRHGRVIKWYKTFSKLKTLEVAGEIVKAMREFPIDHVCIDATGGYGAGVYDNLVGWGYGAQVTPVGFADSAIEDEKYKNRRTEMYWLFKEWLEAGASIPDQNAWLTELCAITYKHDPTSDKLILERKDEIRKRIGKSTDITDAAALTFCMPAITMHTGINDSFNPDDYFGAV